MTCLSFVVAEYEDLDTWLDFASLCRRGGNLALSERVLNLRDCLGNCPACIHKSGLHIPLKYDYCEGLLSSGETFTQSADFKIRFSVARHMWAMSRKEHAIFEVGLFDLLRCVHIDSRSFCRCYISWTSC